MDYVKKFLHVEGVVGQGAFGRVLITSPLENQANSSIVTSHANLISSTNNNSNNNDNDISTTNNANQHNQQPKNASTRFALKCVHPILRPTRLASELRFLRDLGGRFNVVKMHTAHLWKGSLYIVMELIEHDRFVDIVANLDYQEIVIYMKNLLIALEYVHQHNIMHRDIKPANFLFDRKNMKFLLVDFGLAQKVNPRLSAQQPSSASNNLFPEATAASPMVSGLLGSHGRASLANGTLGSLSSFSTSLRFDHKKNPLNQQIGNSSPANKFIQYPHATAAASPCKQITLPSSAKTTSAIAGQPMQTSITPIKSTNKRQFDERSKDPADFDQMLKKLRVSSAKDDIREPVKLVVGAYESPVTHNDSMNRRSTFNRQSVCKFSTPVVPSRRLMGTRCDCRDRAKTCSICLSRPDSNASKSGTPGFKAPEILLKSLNQTTALDIWSAGVIFACLLAGHTPMFRDVDDATSLAEIITLLGSQKVVHAAQSLGSRLTINPRREPVGLVKICKTLRYKSKDKKHYPIPDSAYDLLTHMLDPNPNTRLTASGALAHPFFR